jgi:hypothetical protein
MERKKLVIVLVVVCVALFTVACVLESFREVSERVRDVQVNDVCQKLSFEATAFRVQEGHYPHSLPELESADYLGETEKRINQELIGVTQHNNWHDMYDYIPSTNGFTIIVTGPESLPAGWFGKKRKVERHYDYELGEALNGSNAPSPNK